MARLTDGAELLKCSFCGKSQKQVRKLIGGSGAYICDECIELCNEIIEEELGAQQQSSSTTPLPKPREINEFLNTWVIGQDRAKRALSVAVYNHYKRVRSREAGNNEDMLGTKSNILLLGPTGTGKTHLARCLARLLDVPFAIVDATALTEAGYVGEDVENILLRLIQEADGDIKKAEKGIIYVDEIDKIGRKAENASITRDVSGEGVQQALLKIIEGTVASVPPTGGRKHPHQQFLEIDTSGILFIAAGAFAGIEDIVKARLGRRSTGFGSELKSASEMGDLYEYLIRTFNESTNESPGEYFTPRDAIRLMVDLIFAGDDDALSVPGTVRSIYDPTAGTGGMLSIAEEHLIGTPEHPGLELPPVSWTSKLKSREWEAFHVCGSAVEA